MGEKLEKPRQPQPTDDEYQVLRPDPKRPGDKPARPLLPLAGLHVPSR
jgi:hypothetical protein